MQAEKLLNYFYFRLTKTYFCFSFYIRIFLSIFPLKIFISFMTYQCCSIAWCCWWWGSDAIGGLFELFKFLRTSSSNFLCSILLIKTRNNLRLKNNFQKSLEQFPEALYEAVPQPNKGIPLLTVYYTLVPILLQKKFVTCTTYANHPLLLYTEILGAYPLGHLVHLWSREPKK